MVAPVVFFDIGCRDKERSMAFYRALFGWEGEEVNPLSEQFSTGSEGIDGAVTALGHEPHNYVMVYALVEDLEATLEKAAELGGETVVGPLPTPRGGRFAWIKDVEGTLMGVLSR